VTNGGVRDLREAEGVGFQFYAGSVMVSHAYVHLVDCGKPVKLGGVEIRTGDIIHADRHGVHVVPKELIDKIPAACEAIAEKERKVISYCQSPEFTVEGLKKLV
jgi:regulator of RNase E activity RraA